jgi:hypothetical protein
MWAGRIEAMKSKAMPQTFVRRTLRYAPLLTALGIVGAWMWFVVYTGEFLRSPGIFYPLLEIHWPTLFGFGVIVMTILHAIALARGANRIIGIMSLIAMLGVASLFALILAVSCPTATEIETVSFNGSLYRLFYVDRDFRWDYPADAYTVLECNASGRWCHPYATPYFYDQPCPLFSRDAHLEADETTHELVLYVGEIKYPMVSPDRYTTSCPQEQE